MSLHSSNQEFYLNSGWGYWTMSPEGFWSVAYVYALNSTGSLDGNMQGYNGVTNIFGVRPVINLKANVQITDGNGTSYSPYVIET